MFRFIPIVIVLLFGCQKTSAIKSNIFFDLNGYFQGQIGMLKITNPKFIKTVTLGGDPIENEDDSLNWDDELGIFLTLDLNSTENEGKFKTYVDSTGSFSIENIETIDSGTYISSVTITKLRGEIQLIEAHLTKRSFVVDRDIWLSYQPLKGYGIRINEDYIWGKPGTKEIFTQLQAPGYLMN